MFPESASATGSVSVYHQDPQCPIKIKFALTKLFEVFNPRRLDPVLVCIGTDRSTGDCLGPLVGTRLQHYRLQGLTVYGTLQKPVHAVNLVESLEEIRHAHKRPFIIAVDACLGRAERVGFININEGAVKPGTALGKTLPPVGDIHLSGIVNVGGFLEHMVLQNTRLALVYDMAESIARGIMYAC